MNSVRPVHFIASAIVIAAVASICLSDIGSVSVNTLSLAMAAAVAAFVALMVSAATMALADRQQQARLRKQRVAARINRTARRLKISAVRLAVYPVTASCSRATASAGEATCGQSAIWPLIQVIWRLA